MIVTFTANPSLDRTVTLGSALVPGGVHRIEVDTTQPGGKGINVALGLVGAGLDVVALLPARDDDPLLGLLTENDLPFEAIPVVGQIRTNMTVLGGRESAKGGETTKINEPGATLNEGEVAAVEAALVEAAAAADTVMLSGSLAPGFPVDEYARLVRRLRPLGVWIGVDTSDAPLIALGENFEDAAPDFLKPNGLELGQLTGHDGLSIERQAEDGDLSAAKDAALALHGRGVAEVLVTLGGAGGLLVTGEGAWYSPSPKVDVVSTVGAGDSATAGYLIAREAGLDAPARLAYAVAYGAAAVSLPGTTIPTPQQVSPNFEAVEEI